MFAVGNLFNSTQRIVLGGILTGVPTIGLLMEAGASNINKENHPILKTVLETAGKVVQVATALLVINLLLWSLGPVAPALSLTIGALMVATHVLNGIAEHTTDENFKKYVSIADKIASSTSKIFNTVFTAFFAYGIGGIAASVITGLVYGGLSIATLLNKNTAKQPLENTAH